MSRIDRDDPAVNDLNNLLNRRPAMTLLSGPVCVLSHCVRIVLLEKDVECSVEFVSGGGDLSLLAEHNPYSETPTLVDRDISLYDTSVIMEYLDERFPHPPLMPVDPITRAKTRLMISRLSRDWLGPVSALGDSLPLKPPAALKKSIHDGLIALSPLFRDQPYFLGLEYTLVDTFMAPLLWRLPALGIQLPKQASPIVEYGGRLFARPAFRDSLSEPEREMRSS